MSTMEYTDNHRTFLQTIIENEIVSNSDAHALAVKIFNNNAPINAHVYPINTQLQPLNIALKSVKCEHTGEEFWMLTSSIDDDANKFQLEFNHAQLELMRKIYSEIITSEDKCISDTDCLNLCSSLDNKMTKHNAEEFLNNIVTRKWLYKSNGFYYIGARSIGELLPYFKLTYEDALTNCTLCRQIIFHGYTCGECQTLIHNHCLSHYAKIQNPLKCPQCSKPILNFKDVQDSRENTLNDDSNESEEEIQQVKKKRDRSIDD